MANGDVAILTGISYYPAKGFKPLEGPPHDLDLVEAWLRTVGNVQDIRRIQSPMPHPIQAVDPYNAHPALYHFQQAFDRLTDQRLALGDGRLTGRLYLYFAGHGFSARSDQQSEEAAILAANAMPPRYPHINGTLFANIACNWALFQEVVLIMDCCRDVTVGKLAPLPIEDLNCEALAAKVRSVFVYAVPRGAPAPEAYINERGHIHGLLTHVLFKLLTEVEPHSLAGISGSELRDTLRGAWPNLIGNGFAQPRVILGGDGEVYFPTQRRGNEIMFSWAPQPDGTELILADHLFKELARYDLHRDARLDDPPADEPFRQRLTKGNLSLVLPNGLYMYRVTGLIPREGFIKVIGGSQHVGL
jgi:hypothetical protein